MMQPISPPVMPDSRIHAEAALWCRWRPVSLQVQVACSGASTTFGSLVVGWTSDPYFAVTGDPRDYVRVAALRPSVIVRLHETKSLAIPCEATRRWYVKSGGIEDVHHGLLVAVMASPSGGYEKGSVGVNVTLRWKLQFEAPDLSLTAMATHTITPDAGWHRLFTTSDSSWDSTHLTFKENSGGAMVPFTAARHGYIYKPALGTVVKYGDSTSEEKVCSFFTKVQGYSTPGLVLHASADDAKSYINTGDVAHILPYVKAGSTVTPDIPVFVGAPLSKVEVFHPRPPPGGLEAEVERLRSQVEALMAKAQDQPQS